MGDSSEPVRLADVARFAGVSKATASKALTGRPDVSPTTREKVRRASTALGYVAPNEAPSSRTYPTIALVADDITTSYTIEVLKGAATTAMANGHAIATSYIPLERGIHPVPLDRDWLERVSRAGYVGVIALTAPVMESTAQCAAALGLPLVLIDPAIDPPAGVAAIGATNWNGGFDATRHLLELGHRRIAFIQGPPESVPSTERLHGYLSALQAAGVPVDDRLRVGGDFFAETGRDAGRRLLALGPDRPTAIFAANDVLAFGVFDAIREAGLHVPDDISVVGFDDTVLADLATPSLTTVRQPLSDMGAAAVGTVLDLAAGRPYFGPVRLRTELVVRQSTARPR